MRRAVLLCTSLLLAALAPLESARANDWADALRSAVARLDRDTPGALGVYVKRLDDGSTMAYEADRRWYLGSTAKVPIAVAVLQQIDAGRLQTDTVVQLQDVDKVDGSGPLVWNRCGTQYSVRQLLERMLGDSDNTAANMLVRLIGPQALNSSASAAFGASRIGELTDFTQVRRDVYTQLHPRAGELSNRQLVEVAAAPMPQRAQAVQRALGLRPGSLPAVNDEANARD